jgi:hypothetical protein
MLYSIYWDHSVVVCRDFYQFILNMFQYFLLHFMMCIICCKYYCQNYLVIVFILVTNKFCTYHFLKH